jgi:hypothetical protein
VTALFAGPFGPLLDRPPWQTRLSSGDLRCTGFAFAPETPPRTIGDTSLVVGTSTQQGTSRGAPVDGRFRGSLSAHTDHEQQEAGR